MTNNIKPDKPFKTLDEQIQILKDRKLLIEDNKFAKHALLTFSYYNLINGYKECFMINDEFRPNVSIEYLYQFTLFDHNIQNLIFPYTIDIETRFKTALAYIISKKYGVFQEEYLSKNNYMRGSKNQSDVNKILNDIKKTYNKKEIKFIDQPTRHYFLNKNHIPPWILFKNISFNNAINLYSILQPNDKKEVCNMILDIDIDIEQKKQLFKNCLSIIRKFRNKIAHNLKFITYKTPEITLSKKVLKNTQYKILFDKKTYNKVYSLIIAINIMLNDMHTIFDFNSSLIKIFNFYNEYNKDIVIDYCKITEIPLDIEDKLSNYLKNIS